MNSLKRGLEMAQRRRRRRIVAAERLEPRKAKRRLTMPYGPCKFCGAPQWYKTEPAGGTMETCDGCGMRNDDPTPWQLAEMCVVIRSQRIPSQFYSQQRVLARRNDKPVNDHPTCIRRYCTTNGTMVQRLY